MTNQNTRNILSEIIQSGEFSRFINLKEDLYFEAKGKNPYNFDSPIYRYELAKDVSALANAQGGYIIIGLQHKKIDEERTEKIIGLDLIKKENFLIIKYQGIIRTYVYPPIKNLKIEWIESVENPKYGIGCILIPSQDEDKKYFLIANVVRENQLLKKIVFGLAQRIDSSNTVLTIKQLYQKLQQGKSPVAKRLTRIEDKIDLIIQPLSHSFPTSPTESIEKRIEERIKKMRLFNR